MIAGLMRPPRLLRACYPQITWCGDRGSGRVFLTFDDGPHPEFTPRVLDILGNLQAGATFFLVGARARAHPQIVRRIVRDGHTLGNHSYDHRWMAFRGREWMAQQLEATQRCIGEITGTAPRWFRPPYGVFDRGVLGVAEGLGLKTVIWSLVPYDTRTGDGRRLVGRVMGWVRDGDIIDLHDGHARSGCLVAGLEGLVGALRARGLEPEGLGGVKNA